MTFGLVKHNNNSLSAITSGGQLAQGKMTLLQTQTASSSSSVDFTSNIDSTYPIYIFKFINVHPATDGAKFQFQTDTGTVQVWVMMEVMTKHKELHFKI